MTNHLLAETIPREQADIAAYYATGAKPPTAEQLISDDVIVARFAKAVADGVMQEDAVIALAVEAKRKADLSLYRDDLSPPERVADLHARLYLAGLEDLEEARSGTEEAARSHIFASRDDPDRFDKAAEWAQERLAKAIDGYEAEECALERKYLAAFERARQVREFGNNPPVALRRDMHPLVARGLGVDPERPILDPAQINALISGRRSDGASIAGKHYASTRSLPVDLNTGKKRLSQPIGAYDFCPTPDKSVSVAWAFAPPPEQATIYNAHIDAARRAVAYIGREIGVARHGEDRSEIVPGHIGWMEFTHYTSRKTQFMVKDGDVVRVSESEKIPGDPNLHTHFLIPNAVFCGDGRVGSLHTARIRGFLFEADAVYHATLAQNLRDAGFDADVDRKTGAAVMRAVQKDACTLYSKRTNAGELYAKKLAAERGEDWEELSSYQKETRIKSAVQRWEQRKDGDKDDMADVGSWRAQAREIGWDVPVSFQAYGPLAPEMTREHRLEVAYEASLDFIERKLEQSAVITRWDLRAAAGYGLVHSGSRDSIQDINAVTQMMRKRGVRQYGEMTELAWGHEAGERHVSVTTALHIDQEKEFIALGKKDAADHSAALPRALLDQTILASGLDFSDEHGKAQLAMIYRLGTGGRFALGVGAAGMGKSTALKPMIAAWKIRGREVFGASLASRTTDEMVDSGIAQKNLHAFSVMVERIKSGQTVIDRNGVLVLDEFAMLGTRQGLEILRLQAKHGFQIVSVGDPKQCQAQPLDAQVLTPTGFRSMGSLKVGDLVSAPDGGVAHITGVSPQGVKEIFRLTFSDGRQVECCADHLWKVWKAQPVYSKGSHATRRVINKGGEWRILPLSEIASWFDRGLARTRKAAVPLVAQFAIDFPTQSLPIPPYALGIMLGDGSFGDSVVTYTTADPYLIERLRDEMPYYEAVEFAGSQPSKARQYRLRLRDKSLHTNGRRRTKSEQAFGKCVRVGGRREVVLEYGQHRKTLSEWAEERGLDRVRLWRRMAYLGWTPGQALGFEYRHYKRDHVFSPLALAIASLGLKGTRSHNKFIPGLYKRSGVSQRLDIIRGLLDTDGTVGEGGTYAVYYTSSERMAIDVQEVARSLGAIATISSRLPKAGRIISGRNPVKTVRRHYYVNINHPDISQFFSLPRKVALTKRFSKTLRLGISHIESVGYKEAQCITVDHPDRLYVTDGYVVTHNSIEAGDIIALSRRTLGSEQIPHIETTVRQQTDREKEIVGLLREGKARQAIDMKLEDGTALMVPGGYNECVERVAKLYAERLKETGEAPSITVPTNFDAHQVSIRVRSERKKVGLVGADVKRIDAEDLEGRRYEMRLAPGDRVRLFKSIGQGLRNGSVVDVVALDGSGIRIRSKPQKKDEVGKERFVPWSRLQTDSGRILLSFGDALTIHSAQSMTRDEHIYAFPSGSQAVNGLAAYSAGTRHRHKAWLVTSDIAEMRDVKKHRPINDSRDVTADDKWANVAGHFSYQPEKDLALAMLERVETLRRGTVMQFPQMLHTAHMRQAAGEAPSFAHEKAEEKRAEMAMGAVAQQLAKSQLVQKSASQGMSA